MPASGGRRLAREDVCIVSHNTIALPDGRLFVQLSSAESFSGGYSKEHIDCIDVLRLATADLDSLVVGLKVWVATAHVSATLDLPSLRHNTAVMKLVTSMVMHPDAWQTETLTDVDLSTLAWLQDLGLVQHLDNRWELTLSGATIVITVQEMEVKRHVFEHLSEQAASDPQALKNATSWQMLRALQERGLEVHKAPPPKLRSCDPVLPDSRPEQVWITGRKVSNMHGYLSCMLSYETLFQRNALQIHHFQKEAYYIGLLDGTSTGEIEGRDLPRLQRDLDEYQIRAERLPESQPLPLPFPLARKAKHKSPVPDTIDKDPESLSSESEVSAILEIGEHEECGAEDDPCVHEHEQRAAEDDPCVHEHEQRAAEDDPCVHEHEQRAAEDDPCVHKHEQRAAEDDHECVQTQAMCVDEDCVQADLLFVQVQPLLLLACNSTTQQHFDTSLLHGQKNMQYCLNKHFAEVAFPIQ
eukprot:6482767-Amphidinium_carterae.1